MKGIRRAVHFFFPDQEIIQAKPLAIGHINQTLLVYLSPDTPHILQQLSPSVFPDPAVIMNNIKQVISHLRRGLQNHPELSIQIPALLASPSGATSYVDSAGTHWRMLTYIEKSRTLHTIKSREQAQEIGRILGSFHMLLSDLEPAMLKDPLPGFHQTPEYLNRYDDSVRHGSGTKNTHEQYCAERIEDCRRQVDILEQNRPRLSQGIIHGDPKVSNFLFAENKNMAISLIDLDTVMPGLLLHDLGDVLRSCCNSAGEDITDPSTIFFDPKLFIAVLHGYCSQARHLLNDRDRQLLVDAAWLICFELGLRFFSDHLTGNHYFQVTHPDQNLYRALVQFQLADSILQQRTILDLLSQQIMMADNQ